MKLFSLLFVIFSTFSFAQTSDEELIKETINTLFDGMKTSDSAKITKAFSHNAIMQSGAKKGGVKTDKVEDFASIISQAEKGSLDERITFAHILIDGNLASVWTPYEFYSRGRFSHCGVNSFQLIKINNEWKIQYIIDTRRKDNCIELK